MKTVSLSFFIGLISLCPGIGECKPSKVGNRKDFFQVQTKENTKEVRHFYQKFGNQKLYSKGDKQYKRQKTLIQSAEKSFDFKKINRPFVRHFRSAKIGTVPVRKI